MKIEMIFQLFVGSFPYSTRRTFKWFDIKMPHCVYFKLGVRYKCLGAYLQYGGMIMYWFTLKTIEISFLPCMQTVVFQCVSRCVSIEEEKMP